MILSYILLTLAIVMMALSLGAMLFFGAGVAPAVFKTLPEADAGRLIRVIFPRYYAFNGVVVAIAAALAMGVNKGVGVLLLIVAAGFFAAKHVLMPRINALRDLEAAGDKAAGIRFRLMHRLSVQLNLAQVMALIIAIGWIARTAGSFK